MSMRRKRVFKKEKRNPGGEAGTPRPDEIIIKSATTLALLACLPSSS
jgi:hypothetical protein